MRALIDQAVASKPDGLVVSIPEPGLAPAIRRAVRGRHPGRLDQLRQRRLPRASACSPTSASPRSAPGSRPAGGWPPPACAARCASTSRSATRASTPAAAAWRGRCASAGGRSRVLGVDDQSPATPRRIADAVRSGRRRRRPGAQRRPAGSRRSRARASSAARRASKIGTFDLGPDVLRAVRAGQLLLRGRPAGLPAGLPADRAARRARALRPLPGPGRRPPHRARTSSRARTRARRSS